MRIAIQGVEGSFHHEAAEVMNAGEAYDLVPKKTFGEVFGAVHDGSAEVGLTAIENNLHGSINAVYALLDRYNVWITKDLRMQIVQNLIGKTAVDLSELKEGRGVKVLSHPVALAQVDQWLNSFLPLADRIERDDTASSVKSVVESPRRNRFAVAGKFAAQMYGAEIVASNIQDDPSNYTRFIMFQKEREFIPDASHGSLIMLLDHTPGALHQALGIFAQYGCNLVKLHSHPLASDRQHYQFYVDYELNKSNGNVLADLNAMGADIKLLGFYNRVKDNRN